MATFGNLWYFLHLIGNYLESNFKENKADWKAIGKRLESDWKAIGKRLESDWKAIGILLESN